jgi:hypothetical protein
MFWNILSSLRGTDVRVTADGNHVLVGFFRRLPCARHRRIILGLVALGRITPAEAERLLVAGNDRARRALDDCRLLMFSLLTQLDPRHVLPQLAHFAHALLPALTLHHALALHRLMGGM